MTEINRRGLIGVAGAGLVVAACSGKTGETGQGTGKCVDPNGQFEIKSYEPSWNNGDDPKKATPPEKFNPEYVAIWHIAFDQDLVMNVNSVHLTTIRDSAGNNSWDSNKDSVIEAIEKLNKGDPVSNAKYKGTGIKDLAFGQAHHLIIYVKNRRVTFNSDHPIWFGRKLRKKWKYKDINGNDAFVRLPSENNSFYGADVKTGLPIDGGSATSLVYVQNHFLAKKPSTNNVEPVAAGEGFAYAMNINAIVEDNGLSNALLIIDPDTGNMGSGGPP